MPNINAAGLALIEAYEGERLRSYPDPGTNGYPWTIGYGTTANVHPGEVITHAQAIQFLMRDVRHAELAVAGAVEVNLSPNAFSALVSWQYNTGAIVGSPMVHCVNAEDTPNAMMHLKRYVYAGGHVMVGLVARRAAEAALYVT